MFGKLVLSLQAVLKSIVGVFSIDLFLLRFGRTLVILMGWDVSPDCGPFCWKWCISPFKATLKIQANSTTLVNHMVFPCFSFPVYKTDHRSGDGCYGPRSDVSWVSWLRGHSPWCLDPWLVQRSCYLLGTCIHLRSLQNSLSCTSKMSDCTEACKTVGYSQKTILKIGPYHIDDYKTMQNDSGLNKFANDLSVSHKFWPYLNYIYVDGNCGLWNVPLPFND